MPPDCNTVDFIFRWDHSSLGDLILLRSQIENDETVSSKQNWYDASRYMLVQDKTEQNVPLFQAAPIRTVATPLGFWPACLQFLYKLQVAVKSEIKVVV